MTMFKVVFWHWWALAAVLLVFEMMLPGVVFMFLAIGALASGLFLLVVPDLTLEWQLLTFAVIAVVSAVGLRRTLRRLQNIDSPSSTLNARGDSLIGRTLVLDAPILAGRGRIKLGDGSWTVTGPDMVAGAKVRVTGINGTELTVVPAP
ncbi:MAG: NfeD family protein [Reyranella sp.]|nr:NfeD family protein [Reyranella sp.]